MAKSSVYYPRSSKPDLFDVLPAVPDLNNRRQMVALCHAYGADVRATMRIRKWLLSQ